MTNEENLAAENDAAREIEEQLAEGYLGTEEAQAAFSWVYGQFN